MSVSPETISQLNIAAKAASDKLAENLVALDVSVPFALAEVFLICSAKNDRQYLRFPMQLKNRSKGQDASFVSPKEERLPAGFFLISAIWWCISCTSRSGSFTR